jgi:Flp pilus assembly protein CpaB
VRRSTRILVIGVVALILSAVAVVAMATARDAGPPGPSDDGDVSAAPDANGSPSPAVEDASFAARIPEGMQAVSVRMGPAAGLAGYVEVGDRVNVHAVIDKREDDPLAPVGDLQPPLAKLVLPGVEVLDVRSPAPGGDGTVTYLLALEASDAERIIFLASFESVWLTLVGAEDEGPHTTPGMTYEDIL